MFSDRSLSSTLKVGVVVLALSAFSNLHAQSATAPTASEDPNSIDLAWPVSYTHLTLPTILRV